MRRIAKGRVLAVALCRGETLGREPIRYRASAAPVPGADSAGPCHGENPAGLRVPGSRPDRLASRMLADVM